MPVQSSAGYPQYSGNIITPEFSDEMLVHFYEASVFANISTTEFSGKIENMGDQVTFFREPDIQVRDYQKGQKLQFDQPTFEPVTMTIDRAKYFGFHFDDIDQKQIGPKFSNITSRLAQAAAYRQQRILDNQMLSHIWAEADPQNRGSGAGSSSGAFNLGTTGAPISITTSTITEILTRPQAVLHEAEVPSTMGRPFLVLPHIAHHILLNSELRNADFSGQHPLMQGGFIQARYAEFDLYFTNQCPVVIDPDLEVPCYQIVAGYQMATGFAAQIQKTETTGVEDGFGQKTKGLFVYGFKTLYNKAIAAVYARFS